MKSFDSDNYLEPFWKPSNPTGMLPPEPKQNTTDAFANDYVGENSDEAKALLENSTAY